MKKMNDMDWLAYRLNVLDDIDIGVFLDFHWEDEWKKLYSDPEMAFDFFTEHMSLEEFTKALDESEAWDYHD
jgi:hypothetical protein